MCPTNAAGLFARDVRGAVVEGAGVEGVGVRGSTEAVAATETTGPALASQAATKPRRGSDSGTSRAATRCHHLRPLSTRGDSTMGTVFSIPQMGSPDRVVTALVRP